MTHLIPLVCLVVVLVGYRLAEPRCRWLYCWWNWKRVHDARINTIKSKIALAFLPVMTQAIDELGKAARVASASMHEFGATAVKLGETVGNLSLDDWRYTRATGEVRE